MKKTIVVVGAGKGLGNHIAEKFAQNDFRVVLMARNGDSLNSYKQEFTAKGYEVETYELDATNDSQVREVFGALKEIPDVLVYNVGITTPDPENMDAAELERHFAADVAGAYSCIRQVSTEEFGKKHGTIILTGGYAAVNPFPGYMCLALTKAALRNLALVKNRELTGKGIFVGTVMIGGEVTPGTHFAPELIAGTYWKMYTERKEWELRYE